MTRQFDDILLGSIELFCSTAELGSFTAAATAAGVTPAAVSRAISRLEARLDVRLFVRTTRTLHLTEAGREYYEQCRAALAQLVEAERMVTGRQSAPSGLLRISLPTPYGHYRVLPLLPEFTRRYPDVRIEFHLSNRNVDFGDEGFDLAIRGRTPPDSTMISRQLEDAELVVVASPDYLERAGTPDSLEALRAHNCIQFALPSNGRNIPWLFRDGGADIELPTNGLYGCAGDILGAVTLARAGGGVFQTYRFIVEDDLRAGRLVELLPRYGGRSRPFCLLYPHARHVALRVRAFVDFLVEQLRG
ncbi:MULTISPECIES: LysR family transcriptional regulator [unclassified Massilia]|uniref:LysR family transcriptional regulator n=1 Tax=unclassified Massilia TaxID=2609279 RepID=UPI001B8180EE|nr:MULTISPECIES: LysR family transcriptional regulator [unclassified Massilia]MBQ5940216.1 LysR family transcriptional regulator [Massilia sp. AB1]MBQ5962788.1 LysR family transcriptional regulator [Massilia sp. ZL223]